MNIEEFLALDLEKEFGFGASELTDLLEKTVSGQDRDNYSKMSECYKVQSVLRNKDRATIRRTDLECSQCSKTEVYCGFADLATGDYEHNFCHVCLNCLNASHSVYHIQAGMQENSDSVCPFCEYRW